MNAPLDRALTQALGYLVTLAQDRARPGEAMARLRALEGRDPDIGMDLLWEEEAFDRSVHYDVLLRPPGGGTVSLSFCPDRALPWPMRGVHRWSERDLLRVNDTTLTVGEAIA